MKKRMCDKFTELLKQLIAMNQPQEYISFWYKHFLEDGHIAHTITGGTYGCVVVIGGA